MEATPAADGRPLKLAVIGGTSLLKSTLFVDLTPVPTPTPHRHGDAAHVHGVPPSVPPTPRLHPRRRLHPPPRHQPPGARGGAAGGGRHARPCRLLRWLPQRGGPPGHARHPRRLLGALLPAHVPPRRRAGAHCAGARRAPAGPHPHRRARLGGGAGRGDGGVRVVETGVYVQTPGPRFETPAEVRVLAANVGAAAGIVGIVGMTAANEATVCKEAALPYAAVCMVDNYANGIGGDHLTEEAFHASVERNKSVVESLVKTILEELGIVAAAAPAVPAAAPVLVGA
eukprot:TRINITY_DN1047_c0_g1_i5.p1 TRINITY_DN1047_c0_g1~~TRINITY_DN1047_c0_g1_i5.p1  ORF type:complete len:285 (-),score=65.78 TRINITY_DN1047_c0_g1_i5:28-882(-)